MTEQQIKDNAPDGATHYRDYGGSVAYYKITSAHKFFWNFNYWAITYRDVGKFAQPL